VPGLDAGGTALNQTSVAPPAPRQAPAAAPARGSMSLIGSANAAPARPAPVAAAAGGGNGWSVNLGRFASENLARSAASSARSGCGQQCTNRSGTHCTGEFECLHSAGPRAFARASRTGLPEATRHRQLHIGCPWRLIFRLAIP